MYMKNSIFFKVLEHKKQNKVLYYIEIEDSICGFFALFRRVLSFISYADRRGWIPVVVYGRDTLYSEKEKILGTENAFEYYFEQNVVENRKWHDFHYNVLLSQIRDLGSEERMFSDTGWSYYTNTRYIARMADMYKNYIRLNDRTDKYIYTRIARLLKNKKTLGVHIRGTDFNKQFNNHPVPVTVKEYVNLINQVYKKYGYKQVFIATDDERCLQQIRKELKVPIVYYKNTKRSSTNRSVAFSSGERKYDKYHMGLEVLTDAYTLAECDGFIGCLSQVDICVQIIKKSMEQEFEFIKIIDNGTVKNDRDCWEPRG